MLLGAEALAPTALPNQFLGVLQSSRPEETMTKSLGNEGSGSSMVATFTLMDVLEDGHALLRLYTALEDASRAAFDKFSVDDCVGGGPALHLPGRHLVGWELAAHQKVEDGLRPRWSFHHRHDSSQR